ncbi:MAG TPA: hypothetical protein DCF33_17355 [Saprospirales bacterium]|nr:hypothetical protein [Saprospirales bacterium]
MCKSRLRPKRDREKPASNKIHATKPYNAERFEEAEKCYKQGLAIEPKELLTLIWLASIYMKTQRVEEAKALLIDAMKYDSTSTASMINLANAFEENGFFP